jgi:carboxypeptidase family protein
MQLWKRHEYISSLGWSLLMKAVVALLLLIFTLASWSKPCFAQGATAAINGTVTDSSGAVIPGGMVLLRNAATGIERSAVTNSAGQYVFPDVIPGAYTLRVSKEGFSSVNQSEFTLNVNETSTHDVTLPVGATTQQVTVTAAATHLETASAELGTTIGTSAVNDLPLNGRNFTQLLDLTPGVSPISTAQNSGGGGGFAGNAIGTFSFPSVNGQGNRSDMFLVDGFNDYGYVGNYAVEPIIDQIQEFKVQSHNDIAAYGGVLGGIVNVVTKSGTNEYHGDAWEFLRNNALDARNTFVYNQTDAAGNEIPGTAVTPYKQNQFGVVVGGPILPSRFRNGDPKSFFFIGYEGFRSNRAAETPVFNPPPQLLSGDLSGVAQQIYNPWSTAPDPAHPGEFTRQPFMCDNGGNALTPNANGVQPAGTPCNKIPGTLIDKPLVGYFQAMLAKSPVENTGTPYINFIDTTPAITRNDAGTIRFDHQFTDNTTGWVRYTGTTTPSTSGTGLPTMLNANFVHGYQAGGAITHTFSGGTKVWTGRFGRTSAQANVLNTYSGVSPTEWVQGGFAPAFAGDFPGGLNMNPGIGLIGYNGIPQPAYEGNRLADIWEGATDFTWIHGHHTIQMGLDINSNNNQEPIYETYVDFTPIQTDNPEIPGSGNSVASMLLGVPNDSSRRSLYFTEEGGWEDGFYIQDQWKATRKLVVNFGLRYDVTLRPILGGPPGSNDEYIGDTDLDTGQYILNKLPPPCSATVFAPCIPGGTLPANVVVTSSGGGLIVHNALDNWQPRLGLAYRLRPNTVLRASGTKYYDNWAGALQTSSGYEGTWPSEGFVTGENLNLPTAANPTPITPASEPLSLGVYPPSTPFNQAAWFVDPHYQDPYSLQWNFGVQQLLGNGMTIEADYVGAHDARLDEGGYWNVAPTPGGQSPIPYITPTYYDKSIGLASYNGFQFTLRKTASKGLTFLVAYTYSKTMNMGSDGFYASEGSSIEDPYDLRRDWSEGGYDLTHQLNASWVYNLPFGSGQRFKSSSRVVNAVVGNWKWNGIGTFRSGVPYNANASGGDIENTGNVFERANQIGPPYMPHPTREQFLNPASFVDPPANTFGTEGRNNLRTPHVDNFDMSLFREFPFTESKRLEFRVDAFNTFNWQALNYPDSTVGDPNFGKVFSTAQTEREIQFALKLFW